MPPGNIATTAHVHFPFKNKDIQRCKHYIRDEDDESCPSRKEKEYTVVNDQGDEENNSKERNQERKSANIDDPRLSVGLSVRNEFYRSVMLLIVYLSCVYCCSLNY